MVVSEVTECDDELVEAFDRLIPQLSSSNPPPTASQLRAIVESDASILFVAREDGRIVGSLTLALFPIPTGLRSWIEDVVVDEAALDRAAAEGARTVDLTSRPSREAANRLYKRLGFSQRETNVYRFSQD